MVVDNGALCEVGLKNPHLESMIRSEQSRISWKKADSEDARAWHLSGVIKAQDLTILIQKLEFERLEQRVRELKDRLYRVDGVEGLVMDLAAMSLDPRPGSVDFMDISPPWHLTLQRYDGFGFH
ncbi:hypothetical protein BKA70DRAFT_1223841 [Coprinopsis sp. MPI-PUGE-AT-0042]|nr:hypothetical protein BKA70DRAFT_1223841 [Coprinopsis sp. MPI-PUGE-AT-0042]